MGFFGMQSPGPPAWAQQQQQMPQPAPIVTPPPPPADDLYLKQRQEDEAKEKAEQDKEERTRKARTSGLYSLYNQSTGYTGVPSSTSVTGAASTQTLGSGSVKLGG